VNNKQFHRRARLTIAVPVGERLNEYGANVVEVTDLRFTFKVTKNLAKEPNTAEVELWNLSEQTRAEMQDKVLRVTLEAGYGDDLSTVFVGDSRHVDSAPEGPDWKTKIELGDGERAYRHGRVRESFRAGARVTAVLQKVADSMQLDSTQVLGVDGLRGRQYVAGYVAHGRASRELDKILKGYGYEWSVQDGKLQVLAPEAATAESVVDLSAESGLVGSPTMNTPSPTQQLDPFTGKVKTRRGKPTLKARALLRPDIKPGRRVLVTSVTGIHGLFKVTEAVHSGDTRGSDWYTDFEGVQSS
jgi:hypothetical protein